MQGGSGSGKEMQTKFWEKEQLEQKQKQILRVLQNRKGNTAGLVEALSRHRGSGKAIEAKFWEMTLKKHLEEKQMQKRMGNTACPVEALSRHREILRRDISFLRTEVEFRHLETIDGKISYLKKTQQMSESSVQKMESSAIKVRLPYLVSNHDEALDFLLHETLELGNRIQSLASVMREFNIPISQKVKILHIMFHSLQHISQHILTSDATKSPEGKKAISMSSFDRHKASWKSIWGSGKPNCGSFGDITTLSPMQFTHYPRGNFPFYGTTGPVLQIYSIKIVELNANLDWPLSVYGVIAARDEVDHNRNILFSRSRCNYQVLTENDPFLRLTGPSRAIVATEPVTFEVDLKIMYGAESQDTAVMSCNYRYWSAYDDTPEIGSGCCTVQLSHEQLGAAIQATIVGVQLVEGDWPFAGGCQVSCFSSAAAKVIGNPTLGEVVLLDCRGGEKPVGVDGYIRLSRNVVSVKLQGTLRVCIQAFTQDGIAARGHVDIPVEHCQTSHGEFFVGNSKVKVVVVWSPIVMEKEDLTLEGYVAQA